MSGALDVVKVVGRALWSPVRSFSGGNQQKIAVAKWLLTNSRVLLLYDPTRGIDVGTKTEIYHLIRRYADAGGAVLFYSTEIPELVNLCDQVMVIYRGRIVETLGAGELSESAIMSAALGRKRTSGPPEQTRFGAAHDRRSSRIAEFLRLAASRAPAAKWHNRLSGFARGRLASRCRKPQSFELF